MPTIDGSDGGGQVVRSALTCAALTGEAVRVEDVRGGRPNPGMRPQHVAAAVAVAALCDGDLDGSDVGSEILTFEPGLPRGGKYEVAVGTAGAVPLVCDAVLPLATVLDEPLSLAVTGGTDVKWAPPVDYYRYAKLPLLRQFGLRAGLDVDRRGFYPAGGGRATLSVEPSTLSRLELAQRGDLESVAIHSVAAAALGDADVADRQATAAADALDDAGVPARSTATYADADSPGSAIVLAAHYEDSHAGFSAIGERGLPSEDVADRAVEAFRSFDDGPGAVDEHLADQCMLPLAIAGGAVRIPAITDHVRTNRDVLAAFGADLTLGETPDSGAVLESRGGLVPCSDGAE